MVQCQALGQMKIGLVIGLVLGPVRIGPMATLVRTHGNMVVTARDSVPVTLWNN